MLLYQLKRRVLRNENTIPGMCLTGCWIAGSFLGFLAACSMRDVCADAAERLLRSPSSVGGVLVTAVFPVFISACAVILFGGIGCCGCCLIRGTGQGFALGAICLSCSHDPGLTAFYLMFSKLLTNPVMLLYWLRRMERGLIHLWPDTALCALWCAAVGLGDYRIAAPFLAEIIY